MTNMMLLSIGKVAVLGAAIFFVVPLMLFLIIGLVGRHFALTIHRDSWVATTKNKFIRRLTRRFLV